MLTLDVLMNGMQIAYIEIVDKKDLGDGLFEYAVKVYDDDNVKGYMVFIRHTKTDSYLVLLKKAFEEICENYL